MARKESRTQTAIWRNADFLALRGAAQRLYWLLYSQATITLCGVIAYTPKRWAAMCADDTPESVIEALGELEERRFVVTDPSTEEVLIRSFMRADGVSPAKPKVWDSAMGQLDGIVSSRIRDEVEVEIARILDPGGCVSDTRQSDALDTHPDTHPSRDHSTSETDESEVLDTLRVRAPAASASTTTPTTTTTGGEPAAPPLAKRRRDADLEQAEGILRNWYDARIPHPVLPHWPEHVRTIAKFLRNGHDPGVLRRALDDCPTISAGTIEIALAKRKPRRAARDDAMSALYDEIEEDLHAAQ